MYRILAYIFLILAGGALARDNGQYAQVDPETRQWFNSLENKNRARCCDDSDGRVVKDADVKRTVDGYEVFVEGKWYPVPPHALLTVPNRMGVPIVWFYKMDGIHIVCFLPGALM